MVELCLVARRPKSQPKYEGKASFANLCSCCCQQHHSQRHPPGTLLASVVSRSCGFPVEMWYGQVTILGRWKNVCSLSCTWCGQEGAPCKGQHSRQGAWQANHNVQRENVKFVRMCFKWETDHVWLSWTAQVICSDSKKAGIYATTQYVLIVGLVYRASLYTWMIKTGNKLEKSKGLRPPLPRFYRFDSVSHSSFSLVRVTH